MTIQGRLNHYTTMEKTLDYALRLLRKQKEHIIEHGNVESEKAGSRMERMFTFNNRERMAYLSATFTPGVISIVALLNKIVLSITEGKQDQAIAELAGFGTTTAAFGIGTAVDMRRKGALKAITNFNVAKKGQKLNQGEMNHNRLALKEVEKTLKEIKQTVRRKRHVIQSHISRKQGTPTHVYYTPPRARV